MKCCTKLVGLATNSKAYPDVLAVCFQQLKSLKEEVASKEPKFNSFYSMIEMRIEKFLDSQEEFKVIPSIKAPHGSPIESCDF